MRIKLWSLLVPALLAAGSPPACGGLDAKFTLQVVDENNKPVPGCAGGAMAFDATGGHHEVKGKTNANGCMAFELKTTQNFVPYGVDDMPGFYPSRMLYRPGFFEINFSEENGHWAASPEKYGVDPLVKIQLMRIIKPIALIAKHVPGGSDYAPLPLQGKSVGFDLELSDWVAPHGKGKVADLIFTHTYKDLGMSKKDVPMHDSQLRVSFSNPKDGIILCLPVPERVGMRMPHHAPGDGYQNQWMQRDAHLPVDPQKKEEKYDGRERRRISDYDNVEIFEREVEQYAGYFLRLRTKTNEKGEIVSAHYAKIHGNFECDRFGKIRFTYYYNPTPNDTNLEFDPTRNLLSVDYKSKPKPTFKPSDSELDKAEEMRFWEESEASRREKALEKAGGNVKEP